MSVLTNGQLVFCQQLSALLNFSQRVIGAWCLAEESGGAATSRQAQGYFNWLNIGWDDSGRTSDAAAGKPWSTPTIAAQTTMQWILHKADPSGIKDVLLAARGKSDGAQLSAIINSTWTGNSHYGGGGLIHSTYGETSGVKFLPPAASAGKGAPGGVTRSGKGNSLNESRTLPYEFSRGTSDAPNEDSWDCIERLAQEVKWHAWMRNGSLWYASDTWLAAQTPKYQIGEWQKGIDDLAFNVDVRGQTDDCTFHCESRFFAVSPGDCVELVNEGPADGNWIVYDVTRDAGSSTAEVKARRPVKPLKEPAPQVQQKTITTSAGTGGTQTRGGAAGGVDAQGLPQGYANLLKWCLAVSSAKTIYLWGGGHVANENDNGVDTRFDCSGSVCFVLFKAGFLPATGSNVAAGMESFGLPGRGKWFTVWGSSGHTFIEFMQGSVWKRFDTVPSDGHAATGPRVWNCLAPEPIGGEANWTPRHVRNY